MVVLLVNCKVVLQVRDALREQCHLHFARTRVFFVLPVCVDDP
jgi:hypothetical protein